MAEIEYEFGIKSTYYFRTTKEVYHKEIIKKINNLGHEIGYHYEHLSDAKGDIEKAKVIFEDNLTNYINNKNLNHICDKTASI